VSQAESQHNLRSNPIAARLNNLYWECRLGISTRGIVDVKHADSYHYATMFYSTIRKALDFLQLQSSDVLVDIGSGKGRILCCAARYPIQKAIGVDLSEEFCSQARLNAEHMRGRRCPIEVHNLMAQDFNYAEGTAFFLFNPFGASTLEAVLSKIRSDLPSDSRSIRFAYANPVHEGVFAKHAWLEKYESWDRASTGLEHSILFYRLRRELHG
jgi:cyclopropane fatty-acyl-phospholipid synthase-like methyltransferase